eukprot:m.56249 g.56249  ORF g.56249 m.56249 type:complete len:623 (+) comp11182_c0_seq2:148-2016(+)
MSEEESNKKLKVMSDNSNSQEGSLAMEQMIRELMRSQEQHIMEQLAQQELERKKQREEDLRRQEQQSRKFEKELQELKATKAQQALNLATSSYAQVHRKNESNGLVQCNTLFAFSGQSMDERKEQDLEKFLKQLDQIDDDEASLQAALKDFSSLIHDGVTVVDTHTTATIDSLKPDFCGIQTCVAGPRPRPSAIDVIFTIELKNNTAIVNSAPSLGQVEVSHEQILMKHQPQRSLIASLLMNKTFVCLVTSTAENKWGHITSERSCQHNYTPAYSLSSSEGKEVLVRFFGRSATDHGYHPFEYTTEDGRKIQTKEFIGRGRNCYAYLGKIEGEENASDNASDNEVVVKLYCNNAVETEKAMLKRLGELKISNIPSVVELINPPTQPETSQNLHDDEALKRQHNNFTSLIVKPVGKPFFHSLEPLRNDRIRMTKDHMKQIVDVLESVHKSGFVHNDCRFSNFFYEKHESTKALLNDWGSACKIEDSTTTMAPRLFRLKSAVPSPENDLTIFARSVFLMIHEGYVYSPPKDEENDDVVSEFWECISNTFESSWGKVFDYAKRKEYGELKNSLGCVLDCMSRSHKQNVAMSGEDANEVEMGNERVESSDDNVEDDGDDGDEEEED